MTVPYDPEHITYFGETDYRNQRTRFGIKSRDRTRHMYVIGKSGVGKSTLLENMAIQDIEHGEGIAVLDPHGSFADKMLDYVPAHRIKDVIYLAPFDTDNPISFNVLEDVGADKRHFVASGLMSTFKKIWVDAWSARMEYILNNILLALLEYPGSTLLGVNRMLADKDFRKLVVDNVKDSGVKSFWVDEFAKYGDRYMQEAGAAIQNKIGQLTASPLIRNIIGQPTSSFDIRKIMDDQKILIINLSKGRIGEQNTSLLGSMIITKIYLAAMSRAEETASSMAKLPNFYFYVDEFQSFANETFADILAEARKYKLALIIAHQYVAQMEEKVRDAVFGNVGTSVSFRVGPLDAELLEKVFAPQFTQNDLINLGMAQIYLSLMINDIGSPAFSSRTLPPIPRPTISYRNDVIEWTRLAYAAPKETVETNINDWYGKPSDGPEMQQEQRQEYAPRPQKSFDKYAPVDEKRSFAPRSVHSAPPQKQPFKEVFSNVSPADMEKFTEVPAQLEPKSPAVQSSPSVQQVAQQPVYARAKLPRPEIAKKPIEKERQFIRRVVDQTPYTQQKTIVEKHSITTVTTESVPISKKPEQEIEKMPLDETTPSPALSALLASLNFEDTKTVTEKKPEPVVAVEEKPFFKPAPRPFKELERGVTEKSKSLLREALAKVQTEQPVKKIETIVVEKTITPIKSPIPVQSTPQEVSYDTIRKVLE